MTMARNTDMENKKRTVRELRLVGQRKNKEELRVAAYCRVSSDSEDQLNSYSAQIRHYTKYIGENPLWELVDIYADKGMTGTKADSRGDFGRLISDCREGRIDLVLVKSVSRFARNIRDCIRYIRMLKEYGAAVIFEKEGIDTSKLSDELELTMHGLLAEQESRSISKNLRQSYARRMQSGEFNTCRPPTGYSLVNGRLEINESEAAAVRRIFSLFLYGIGKDAIAGILNDEDVYKRTNKHWSLSTVDYILRNERYIGEAILQKRYTSDELPFQRKKNNGERDMYHVIGSNPPIISKDTFEAAQSLIKERSERCGKPGAADHPFNRKIICPDCGRNFFRKISNGKFYWVCSRGNRGRSGCRVIRIEENTLKETSTLLLLKLASQRGYIVDPIISQLSDMQIRTGRNRTQIYLIDKEIAALETKSLVHAKLKANGVLGSAAFAERENEVAGKLLGLRRDRAEAMKGDTYEEAIAGLKELRGILQAGIPAIFDGDIFDKAVKKIVPADSREFDFELIGGLALRERII
jgi:DNA invertase Pin-like site-specific DNA recombinase